MSTTGSSQNNGGRSASGQFTAGNGGRPKGTRNKATLALEALLDGDSEALTKKVIELAKAGDIAALRICLDRIFPVKRDRPVQFDLPPLNGASDAPAATAGVVSAVSQGELTPSEGEAVMKMIETHIAAIQVADHELRLQQLEAERAKAQHQ
jgi:hypothetical protein